MTQHEQKPESAEFRTREDQIETMTVHYMEAGFPINAARRLARDGVAEAEARGAAEQRQKDAEASKAQLFSNREQAAADRTPQREDVRQWQTDQREFFLPSMVEVVTEYAEWRDKKDAEGAEPVAYRWAYDVPKGRDSLWHFGGDLPEPSPERPEPKHVTPLYTGPANVAALEARVKELAGALMEIANCKTSDAPYLTDSRYHDRVMWALVECRRKARAAIREGGEHD